MPISIRRHVVNIQELEVLDVLALMVACASSSLLATPHLYNSDSFITAVAKSHHQPFHIVYNIVESYLRNSCVPTT